MRRTLPKNGHLEPACSCRTSVIFPSLSIKRTLGAGANSVRLSPEKVKCLQILTFSTVELPSQHLLGSLSNNDGKGYKKVTYKVNSRCLKVISLIPSHLIRKIFSELNSKGLYQSSGKAPRQHVKLGTFTL